MASRSPLRYVLILAVAFVALGGVALTAFFAMTRVPDEVHLTFDDYLKEARSATFPRPNNPPGWTLEDGAAADAYWDAYRKFTALKGKDPLDQGDVFAPFVLSASAAPSPAPAKIAAPPPECVALGVPEAPSPLGAALTAGLCERLGEAAVQDALALLNQGCRRRDARAPGRLDDPMAYDGEQPRVMLPFIKLAKLNLIQAHIDAARGKHRDGLSRVLCNVRFGIDLTHAYQLIHTMIGVAIQTQSLDGLRALVAYYPDLARDPKLIAHAVDNLAWYRPSPEAGAQALKGEYLYLMSIAEIGSQDGADLPKHLHIARKELGTEMREQGGLLGNALVNDMVGDMHPYHTGLIKAATTPPSERRAAVQALTEAAEASVNPLSMIAVPNLGAYLVKLDLAIDAHDRMTLALADLHHQLTQDAEATTVEALVAANTLKTAPTCRLSNAAYTLGKTDACRVLDCGTIDPELLPDLDNKTGGDADTYAAKTCLFTAPAPATPPPADAEPAPPAPTPPE